MKHTPCVTIDTPLLTCWKQATYPLCQKVSAGASSNSLGASPYISLHVVDNYALEPDRDRAFLT